MSLVCVTIFLTHQSPFCLHIRHFQRNQDQNTLQCNAMSCFLWLTSCWLWSILEKTRGINNIFLNMPTAWDGPFTIYGMENQQQWNSLCCKQGGLHCRDAISSRYHDGRPGITTHGLQGLYFPDKTWRDLEPKTCHAKYGSVLTVGILLQRTELEMSWASTNIQNNI